jgi:AP-2 complex subunit mu-1
LLKEYIRTGKQAKQLTDIEKLKAITVRATGAVSWRAEGLLYRKNEIYIDIIESVNVLLSSRGTVLKADVLGKIVVKTQLSGMPECKFGVNDRLLMSGNDQPEKIDKGIQIDDIKFHQCVRLGKFDRDRSITFIPPDGTFDIMTYRISENINLPFKIVPVIQEYPELCKIEISVRIKAIFEASNFATGVICYIPVPSTTANVRIFSSGSGKARYEPENKSCIVWRFLRFQGDSESLLTADVQLIPSKNGKPWVKPPITLEF